MTLNSKLSIIQYGRASYQTVAGGRNQLTVYFDQPFSTTPIIQITVGNPYPELFDFGASKVTKTTFEIWCKSNHSDSSIVEVHWTAFGK